MREGEGEGEWREKVGDRKWEREGVGREGGL